MSDIPDIIELVDRAKAGDHQAFGIIVENYKTMVAATVGRFARNEHDREDLAQEVFLKAYQSIKKFRGLGSFEGWLRKLTVHTCLDFLRKTKRQKSIPLSDLGKEKRKQIETNTPDPRGFEAEKKLESEDALKILQDAMASLSADEHLIIVLKELEDRSIKEISEITGFTQGNIKVKAHRARNKLKEILMNKGDSK
ncbi:RNA polymerase sigma factor [bacterium]|nr:RNA polymerase sigma factor [bacterium]